MKKRRSVRLNTCKFVLSVILLASTLFHALPVSADTGVAGASSSFTTQYSNSESDLQNGNTYIPDTKGFYNAGTWVEVDNKYYDSLSIDSVYNNFWYVGKRKTLFTSSADYYGYRITFTLQTKTTLEYEYALKYFWLVGTATDLYNGQFASGILTSSSFSAWVQTDNSVQTIHYAPFFNFEASVINDYHIDETGDYLPSYNINCKYKVTYVGYKTKSDYESAMSEISGKLDNIDSSINGASSEIQENMQAQTDKITSGYDSSGGSDMNDQFSSSVGSYEDASDSLFESASSGLDSFSFANIASYSAIVASLSFVQTVMASIFTAVGGESGPYGVILSVLFSVVLVSLLIGLYRYYQNRKG